MSTQNKSKFLKSLETKIQGLPHIYRLAFGASVCERAYPNYVIFFRRTGWGNATVLRNALDQVWNLIQGLNGALENIDELIHKCESVTPDLDDFSSADIDIAAAAAQEAAFTVRLLLLFCSDNQASYASRIITFAYDTIDMYVQIVERFEPDDPQLGIKIFEHPLMRQEMSNEENDINKLTIIKTQRELKEFLEIATHPKQSNIGLTPNYA